MPFPLLGSLGLPIPNSPEVLSSPEAVPALLGHGSATSSSAPEGPDQHGRSTCPRVRPAGNSPTSPTPWENHFQQKTCLSAISGPVNGNNETAQPVRLLPLPGGEGSNLVHPPTPPPETSEGNWSGSRV